MSKRPTPATPSSEEIGFSFAAGFSPEKGKPIPQIPRDEWAAEIERKHAEENEWWAGELVTAELAVELPFWLMVPDGEITLSFEKTTVTASINGKYLEVSDGPISLASRTNSVVIGPGDEVWGREFPESVVPSQMPVFRPMKTVVTFRANIIADCFGAWRTKGEVSASDRIGIRRVNRVMQYLKALATAHIPFLNKLITSYRSTSLDPYAFEVSEWDVPVWYARHDETLVWIGLMPYWDSDTFPSLNDSGMAVPFVATTLDEVQTQAQTSVAPGKLELLDAYSLMYRGRFGDAVRSAVTGIEVAVEAQLSKLLKEKGFSDDQIRARLEETRNSFFERIQEYEQLSQKRLPGPLISNVPYINGIRLRTELNWVRNLRHKVVHEGIRVDIFERGTTLRAVETMSWLFEWLSWEDEHGPKNSRNYTFFSTLRGQPHLTFEYAEDGIRVSPVSTPKTDEPIVTADELILRQYLGTTAARDSDVDLCARMTFEYLQVCCEQGPPEPLEEPKLRERYLINDGDRVAIVFCLEFDNLIDMATAVKVVERSRECRLSNPDSNVLVVIHHQRQLDKGCREFEAAVPEDVQNRLVSSDATIVTALELQSLVVGVLVYGWPIERAREALFIPGRQATCPPQFDRVATCNKFYPDHSVVSVDIDDGKSIARGARVAIRLADCYHEEEIKSMQVNGEDVAIARGPCKVGIVTSLTKTDVKPGQVVFVKSDDHQGDMV